MPRASALHRIVPADPVAQASTAPGPALTVATIYQDPLTRHWATELWGRVGQLIGDEGACCQSWKISDLTDPRVFEDSVRVAAAADVLIISVRDARELPTNLTVWFDALVPRRAGHAGALVALIGVPPQPDAQFGRAHAYLERIARKAGLDYLPRERKLPEQPFALARQAKSDQTANGPAPAVAGSFSGGPRVHLRWALND